MKIKPHSTTIHEGNITFKTKTPEEPQKTKPNCTCKDSTGWTDMPCCNICGKQVEK